MKKFQTMTVLVLSLSVLIWAAVKKDKIAHAYCDNGNGDSICSLDGSRIQPLYEVICVQKNNVSRHFSCIFSARIWFSKNSGQDAYFMVTDENSGKKISAEEAFYVLSEMITTPHTGNKIHVFADRSTAVSHATQFNGKLIENPFHTHEKKPVITVKYKTDPQGARDFGCSSCHEPFITICFSILTLKIDASTLISIHSNRLDDGFLNLPYKPPRNIS